MTPVYRSLEYLLTLMRGRYTGCTLPSELNAYYYIHLAAAIQKRSKEIIIFIDKIISIIAVIYQPTIIVAKGSGQELIMRLEHLDCVAII